MDRVSPWPRTIRKLATYGVAPLVLSLLIAPVDAHAVRHRRRPHHAAPAGSQPTPEAAEAETEPDTAAATPAASPTTTTTTTTTTAPASIATAAAPASTPIASHATRSPSGAAAAEREAPIHLTTIDIEIGARAFGRYLWFVDDVFARLRPYTVLGAPGVGGSLEWYPGALVTSGRAANIGLIVNGGYNFVLSSTDAQGRSYPTHTYDIFAGLRARLVYRSADVGVIVGYAHQAFTIDRGAVQAPPEGIPSVTFQSIRAGLNGRFQLISGVALTAGAAYHLVLGTGEIGTAAFFPHMTTHGLDFGLGAAIELTSGIEARLNLDWRRYVMTMNPVPGERGPLIAGGAADDYFSATIGIAIRR